jgi:hypothetical protein
MRWHTPRLKKRWWAGGLSCCHVINTETLFRSGNEDWVSGSYWLEEEMVGSSAFNFELIACLREYYQPRKHGKWPAAAFGKNENMIKPSGDRDELKLEDFQVLMAHIKLDQVEGQD